MIPALQPVCRASIPASALGAMAEVRCLPDVRVTLQDNRAWIDWPAGQEQVLELLLPVPGLELYERREGRWFRHGHSLPTSAMPDLSAGKPLAALILPVAVAAEPPSADAPTRCQARLLRDASPRDTTAMVCGLQALGAWAESASTWQITSLEAAHSGERVLLRGRKLPLLPDGTRYWGERLLVPLGFRVWPGLAEAALLEALGVDREELLILSADGGEVVPQSAFQALSRAAVRLACKENR